MRLWKWIKSWFVEPPPEPLPPLPEITGPTGLKPFY